MAVVLNNSEVELVQGRYVCHRKDGDTLVPKEIRITHACTNDEVRSCFYKYNQIPRAAWNKLMKRSLIVDNNLSFIEGLLYEDTPWTYYWMKYVKNAFFLDDVTYHYKMRPGSIVMGTDEDIADIHKLRGYHDIITHLTPGYEKQEIECHTPLFARLFIHQSYHMPELIEDLKIHWRYAWESRNIKLCAALSICYIFRKFK